MPYTARGVLVIDPAARRVSTIEWDDGGGGGADGGGGGGARPWQYHGGALGPDGCIYGFPAHADRVLKVDPAARAARLIGPPLSSLLRENRNGGKYKFGGGVVDHAHGAVFCVPSDAGAVLRVDCATETVAALGEGALPRMKNKWQNGVVGPSDGCVYAIPADAPCVLRIDCAKAAAAAARGADGADAISLVGEGVVGDGEDKWQGGVLGDDGNIYGIPERGHHVLKIEPAAAGPPRDVDVPAP